MYRIGFSIPEEKILNGVTITKTQILSSIIPGKIETYIFNIERDYYEEYQKSYFALTKKKGGWDCLRHYEIIANGCIPYFEDIESCPVQCLTFLPKDLLIEAKELYHTGFTGKIEDLTEDTLRRYNILVNRLVNYLRFRLTTEKMAEYLLNTINLRPVLKILYLSGNIYPDYLRCLTLHGLKKKMKSSCHDYPKIHHLYQSNKIEYNSLYGKGMTYSNLLDESYRDDMLDYTIIDDIIRKRYDIIIYGSYWRGMPYYDLVASIYEPRRVILLYGEDNSKSHIEWVAKGHLVFVRDEI